MPKLESKEQKRYLGELRVRARREIKSDLCFIFHRMATTIALAKELQALAEDEDVDAVEFEAANEALKQSLEQWGW